MAAQTKKLGCMGILGYFLLFCCIVAFITSPVGIATLIVAAIGAVVYLVLAKKQNEKGKAEYDQIASCGVEIVHGTSCDIPENTVVFDLETTGLTAGDDEILQFSAIDGNGNTLLNTYVRPTRHRSWPEAEAINGISPALVEDEPTFDELRSQVQKIFDDATLMIGYNQSFDEGFLRKSGIVIHRRKRFDVMREYAKRYSCKWPKLGKLASDYGYAFAAHDSLEDCKATLYCYKRMNESVTLTARFDESVGEVSPENIAINESMAKLADKWLGSAYGDELREMEERCTPNIVRFDELDREIASEKSKMRFRKKDFMDKVRERKRLAEEIIADAKRANEIDDMLNDARAASREQGR